MGKLYKYVGHQYLDKVFAAENQVTLKCSYPKDFNDPYELFLTMDFNQDAEALAFYAEVIGELPQIPTTCFSQSPIVLPMWAHYAQNLEGVVIEFDEEQLSQSFPKSDFGSVDYKDAAASELSDLLERARMGKFRHVYMLRKAVFSAAYYTKATCWSYEQERRMVVHDSETRHHEGLVLIDVPAECVTGLMCGPRASQETADKIGRIANRLGCNLFDLQVGKSSVVPFLINDSGAFVFDGSSIVKSAQECLSCGEPVPQGWEEEECSLCQINEVHRAAAAKDNSFRMLHHYGLLDDYLRGMVELDDKFRKE